jgi:nucleoid-associated protein YgaU
MPNDAKLGLVVGVGVVIAVAIAFFRKDAPAADPSAATNVQAVSAGATAAGGDVSPARTRQLPAHTPVRQTGGPAAADGRCHTVREGDTLFSLAQQYYGDGEKSEFLYRSNLKRLTSREVLPPGTVLVIPDLPDEGR